MLSLQLPVLLLPEGQGYVGLTCWYCELERMRFNLDFGQTDHKIKSFVRLDWLLGKGAPWVGENMKILHSDSDPRNHRIKSCVWMVFWLTALLLNTAKIRKESQIWMWNWKPESQKWETKGRTTNHAISNRFQGEIWEEKKGWSFVRKINKSHF